jgi:hypothetical protein
VSHGRGSRDHRPRDQLSRDRGPRDRCLPPPRIPPPAPALLHRDRAGECISGGGGSSPPGVWAPAAATALACARRAIRESRRRAGRVMSVGSGGGARDRGPPAGHRLEEGVGVRHRRRRRRRQSCPHCNTYCRKDCNTGRIAVVATMQYGTPYVLPKSTRLRPSKAIDVPRSSTMQYTVATMQYGTPYVLSQSTRLRPSKAIDVPRSSTMQYIVATMQYGTPYVLSKSTRLRPSKAIDVPRSSTMQYIVAIMQYGTPSPRCCTTIGWKGRGPGGKDRGSMTCIRRRNSAQVFSA